MQRSEYGIQEIPSHVSRRTSSGASPTAELSNTLQNLQSTLEKRLRQTTKPSFELQSSRIDCSLPVVSSNVEAERPVVKRAATNTAVYERQSDHSSPYSAGTSEVFSSRSPPQSSTISTRPEYRTVDCESLPEVHKAIKEGHQQYHAPQIQRASSANLPEHRRPCLQQPDLNSFPEVISTGLETMPAATPTMADHNDRNQIMFSHDRAFSKTRKYRGFFKSGRVASSSSTPAAAFFASGKNLLIWNEHGAGYYDFDDLRSIPFQKINASGAWIAAGGTRRCAVVTKDDAVGFIERTTFFSFY
jgi:hypothetical protein